MLLPRKEECERSCCVYAGKGISVLVMLTEGLCDILFREADREHPLEMCGAIFGEVYVGMRNVAAFPEHSFEIGMEEFGQYYNRHGNPRAIVHSHPGAPASISGRDCLLLDALSATGHAQLLMVIVGLNPRQIKAYRKEGESYRCVWSYVAG